ncbi:hypothetical protein NEOLEDRAFT_1222574 [Neolentinus lepideus HHB14362 ss-1]|uniref:GAR domain-containing protein n=1 Tax=Neolentinus lepideus HHB14362 ss-1 TaxID=1314782 RepID=A0A165PVQ1_9AGAM|nr:hypothetical protein NEOLEDRAFT_1222574 [Neolentinus lepideus HHB14362 ss-1]
MVSSEASSISSSRRLSSTSFDGNASQSSLNLSPSPSVSGGSSGGSSAVSSTVSLNDDDVENDTITSPHGFGSHKGKQKSQDDLQLLTVSTNMTELSFGISDIQTRIFEIQELRHKSQSSGETRIIDEALMALDERLEAVARGVKAVTDSLQPASEKTPTQSQTDNSTLGNGRVSNDEETMLIRKHAMLLGEWDTVQSEIDVLREELKEDKWLTVFRTATEQAEGMMTSLEKVVNRCQNFVWQVHRQGPDEFPSQTTQASGSTIGSLNFETYAKLMESFEAKKKHYMPATTKVLSIIDKGVQDRVTKNGECLRRHAECIQRWRNLRERITRTEADMENVRKLLLTSDLAPSESGSSNASKNFLVTPPDVPSKFRAPSVASTLSRSVSPIRRFAKKITAGRRTPAPAFSPALPPKVVSRTSSTEQAQTMRKKRSSLFPFKASQPSSPMSPVTPERPAHKHTQSLTPESSPSSRKDTLTLKHRPAWNSSTRIEAEDRSGTLTMRPKRLSTAGMYETASNGASPYKRSLSRSSMTSSRPWSPVTSSISTAASSNPSLPPIYRPPSRAQTPGMPLSPRSRPRTPGSYIPVPVTKPHLRSRSEAGWYHDAEESQSSLLQRAFSPPVSTSTSLSSLYFQRSQTPDAESHIPPPRPPSRSMIPVPSLSFSSPSRPGSTMSNYRPESSMSFRTSAMRAQTPEFTLRQRAAQIPFYQGPRTASTPRPSLPAKLPPSSFKDNVPRSASRAGASTPSLDGNLIHTYVPANPKDPLDAEVANIVNSIPHGLLVERVDPPLRNIPKEGEEVKAQYAFSNSLARKVINCRLTYTTRNGVPNKRVMCRVGGGWQDLQLYMLNRQAGL